MIELSRGDRVYFDANVLIFAVEANVDFVDAATGMFEHVARAGAIAVTNELSIAECMYKPAATNDARLIADYERLFDSGEIVIVPLDGALAKRAAFGAGALGLKLLDAIHYLCALEARCAYFITADRRIRSGPNLKVRYLTP
jgi:predicted nucleic acid-binding protein